MALTGKIGNLLVALGLDSAQFEQGFANAQKTLSRATRQMESLGKELSLKVTAPLVGIGIAALKASTDFNEAMGKVATLIPGNIERVKELKSGIQDLSMKTGKSTQDLAGGLYHVISAFQDTPDSLKILGIVSKAAGAGLGSLEDSLRQVSSVTKAWGDTSTGAIQKMADFGQEVIKLGQTTLPELTVGVQKVAPVFKVLGGTLEEMYAAFATFSGVTGPAEKVGTQLGALITSINAPTKEMRNLFETMGVTTGPAFVRAAGGMSNAVQMIVKAAQDSETPLKDYLGRKEAVILATVWAGTQAEKYAEKLKLMSDAEGEAGRAAAERSEGINKFGRSLAILNAKLTVVRQNLGDAITQGLAGDAAEAGSSWMDSLVRLSYAFAKADPAIQQFVVGIAAAFAMTGPAALAIVGFKSLITMAFGPTGAIAGALLITAGVVWGLVQVFRDTYGALTNLGTDFSNAWRNLCELLGENWQRAWDNIGNYLQTKLQWMADIITRFTPNLYIDMSVDINGPMEEVAKETQKVADTQQAASEKIVNNNNKVADSLGKVGRGAKSANNSLLEMAKLSFQVSEIMARAAENAAARINRSLESQAEFHWQVMEMQMDWAERGANQAQEAIEKLEKPGKETAKNMAQGYESAFERMGGALKNFVMDGKFEFQNFATEVQRVLWDLILVPFEVAMKSLAKSLGGWLGGWFGGGGEMDWDFMYSGGALAHGGVLQKFARGTVLRGPSLFPMARGLGLAGEAGPEGVLPLARVGGDLGVRAVGAGGGEWKVTVVNNTSTPVRGRAQMGGDRDLIIFLDEVNEQLVESGGRFARALDRRWNASPATVVR